MLRYEIFLSFQNIFQYRMTSLQNLMKEKREI